MASTGTPLSIHPTTSCAPGPSSALYLGVYEACKAQLLVGPLGASPLAVYLTAGAAGELVGSVVRAPSEAAKSRMQSGMASQPGEALAQVAADPEGRARTVRAWGASLLRDVPMGAAQVTLQLPERGPPSGFHVLHAWGSRSSPHPQWRPVCWWQIAVFELLKAAAVQSPDVTFDVNSPTAEACFGALGGLVGAVLTVPADVITTRINTQVPSTRCPLLAAEPAHTNSHPAVPYHTQHTPCCALQEGGDNPGVWEVARDVWREEGLAGFFAGTASRALYWAPAIGIFLSLYCTLRQLAL